MTSWVEIPEGSDFTLQNLPYGIFSTEQREKRVGVAVGEYVLDLHFLQQLGYLDHPGLAKGVFLQTYLNPMIESGRACWSFLREQIRELLTDRRQQAPLEAAKCLIHQDMVTMSMPVAIGDYTDFYASLEHATNVGTMFRGKENALMPNWRHLPVAYHGRSSSIMLSGSGIHRPMGQVMKPGSLSPTLSPTEALDIEVEMAFVIGKETAHGQQLESKDLDDHIFGMVIFNDWSARDIQRWEYVPLGPFLGKNFASTISPWIVTMDALEPFKVSSPNQSPEVLSYLKRHDEVASYDIALEAWLTPKDSNASKLCETNHKHLYWTIDQQLAHHSVNGCRLKVGDLCASGTISGPTSESYGSLLELCWNREKKINLGNGIVREFVEDYDTVEIRAFAQNGNIRVGFGSVKNQILPVRD